MLTPSSLSDSRHLVHPQCDATSPSVHLNHGLKPYVKQTPLIHPVGLLCLEVEEPACSLDMDEEMNVLLVFSVIDRFV